MPRYLFKNPCDIQYLQDGIVEADGLNFGTYERSLWQKVSGQLYVVVNSYVFAIKRF